MQLTNLVQTFNQRRSARVVIGILRLQSPRDRQDGAVFDCFGIFCQETTGNGLEFWLDDLRIDDQHYDFDTDPRSYQVGSSSAWRLPEVL